MTDTLWASVFFIYTIPSGYKKVNSATGLFGGHVLE